MSQWAQDDATRRRILVENPENALRLPEGVTTAKPAYRIAGWQFQRDGEMVRFQLELDGGDFTEKLILDTFRCPCLLRGRRFRAHDQGAEKGDCRFRRRRELRLLTSLASALVGASGHVLAIEPAPDCVLRLKANVARNGAGNVGIVEKVRRIALARHVPCQPRQFGGHALWNPAMAGQ